MVLALLFAHSLIGFGVGAVIAAFLWAGLWNAGVTRVPVKHRATVVWLGARQKGAELGEGLHWIFPGLMTVGDVYDMREQTLVVAEVPIHTRDKIISKVSVSIQWSPKPGQLYYLGDIADPGAAFEAEVREIIRAYSVGQQGIDRLIDMDVAETLKVTIREYLQRRCAGKASKVKFNTNGEVEYPLDNDTQPWGMDIRSVAVTSFGLDQTVTTSAARTEVARAERAAADILRLGVLETVAALRQQGLDPVIALEEGNLLLLPDRASPPVRRWSVTGLDGTIGSLVNGVLTAMGKGPLPLNVTPGPAKADAS
ncbi:SPFH domain-containing protein [Phenylobacterium sp.]|uniref:SPFH domain-containing protein n=1 Tax=Phenylobacterium sp. TaxID=1871053 RepID=UPI002DF4594A|nr:SPFH domain-containing protein [Phenylobacterium sp.]